MQEYSSKSLDIITFIIINNHMCPNQKRPIINNYCMYVDYVLHQVYIYMHLHVIPTCISLTMKLRVFKRERLL